MECKTSIEPELWYSWKRAHPEEYKIIKDYVLQRFSFVTVEYKGQTCTNLLIPRLYFTYGEMTHFLARYRHLRDYEYIKYKEHDHYEGGTFITIDIDFEAVSMQELCDYVWL